MWDSVGVEVVVFILEVVLEWDRLEVGGDFKVVASV